jgi:hypothetical protein
MAEKIIIASLDLDVKGVIASTQQLKQQLEQLKREQIALKNAGQESSQAFIENDVNIKLLSKAYNDNMKSLVANKTAMEDSANASEMLAIALEGEVRTIAEAREQNKLLNRLRNETNATTAEGQAQITQLNAKLDQNNAFIKDNADQYLQQKINIGNYSESIKEALSNLNPLNGGLAGFTQRSQEAGGTGNLLKESLSSVTQGVIGVTRASLAFIATPIGAVIAAIGLVVGLLVNYLKSSQQGIDAVTSVTRPLQAIMTSLMGVLQGVGKMLFEAFSNPKKTLTELYEFVKQNLINRFTAFGKILEGIIELDFKKVTDGVLQAGTGVENLTDKIQNGAKATGKFLDDAIKKGQEIDKLKKEIERSELSYQKAQIKTNDLIDEQLLISKDTSKSFSERAVASNEIIRLTAELSKKEEEIIQKKIKALQLEYSMKDAKSLTIDEQQKMIDLEKQLDEAQDRGLNAQLEQTKVLSGLKKEQEAQQKEAQQKAIEAENKRIDNLINKSRQEIDLFVAQQGFKKKSTEEEYNFNKQIFDKELKDLELRYSKGKVSKLEYETEKLNLSNNFAKANADLLIANAELEIQASLEKNNKILENDNFLNEQLFENKKTALNNILEAEKQYQATRLENGVINEQEYNNAINLINDENKLKLDELEAEKENANEEKRILDLELKRAQDQLTFEEQLAIDLERNEIAKQQELANAEKTGADKSLIDAKYAGIEKKLRQDVEMSKLSLIQQGLSGAQGFFKENTLAYKALAIAEATINTYKAASLALSTYAYPVGGIFAGLAIGQGLLQVGKIAGVKFEKGGIQEVGGKRHSAGGTKFYGEDGTTFEAESGEGIGILNRSAFSTFMDFNNRFGNGSSSSGFFQGGGIITQGVKNETINLDSIVNAIAEIPPPIVAVEEIQSVGNRYVNVQQTANL